MRVITDGERFAIERGWWFFKRCLDISVDHTRFWWYSFECSYDDCWGSEEKVMKRFNELQCTEKRKNKSWKVELEREGDIENVARTSAEREAAMIEEFFRLYLTETGLKPSEAVLVRRNFPNRITFWFEKKVSDEAL